MPNIFLKDEALVKSPAIVGYEIARFIRASGKGRISIFDVVNHFKHMSWFSSNSFFYGITFLYAVGLVEFHEPYLVMSNAD